MDDIEIERGEKYWLISSKKLGISDFGKTFEEAKESFKDAIDLMIQNKLKYMGNENK